jgi:hypothetical protein
MKLPENTLIAREKLTNYLLTSKKRNDKSQWLSKLRGGLTQLTSCFFTLFRLKLISNRA